jgi:hypothetical protein
VSVELAARSGGLADFEPLAQRAVNVEQSSFIRLRAAQATVSGFVSMPYDVIAGRTVAVAGETGRWDVTYLASDFAGWLAGGAMTAGAREPTRRDAHWLSALPPRAGWNRIEKLPDTVIRDAVRSGAMLARDISGKNEQDSLLSSVVVTASSDKESVEVPLRALTALTKMGFLPRDSEAAVDLAPGWIRVAAPYGSTFVSRASNLFALSPV